MRSRSSSLIVFATTCFVFLACHDRNSKASASDVPEPGTIKVIIYHEDSGVSYKHKVGYLRNLAKNLGLPVLTGGYPGIYIRIWAWDSTNTKWVIDLRKSSLGSRCTVLSYTGRVKDTVSYIYIHDQKDVKPISGWTDFYNELEKFHIPEMEKKNLPKDREFGFTSMSYVLFEIDEPNQYRLIEYPDPIIFRNEDKACKMIDDFFRYFNKEMGTSIYDTQKAINE